MGAHPRILLTLSRPVSDRVRQSHEAYRQRLIDAGVTPLAIYPDDDPPETFDGLVLSGGGDIDPREYGQDDAGVERATVDGDRDAVERRLANAALAAGRPVLAICRGMQVLNWVYGGKLVQHVSGHRPKDGPMVPHVIRPDPGSLLAQICGTAPFQVNSRHHQVITETPAGLRATARVDDVVEAVEASDDRWVLGVQWHPETKGDLLLDEAPAARIFGSFVRASERIPAR